MLEQVVHRLSDLGMAGELAPLAPHPAFEIGDEGGDRGAAGGATVLGRAPVDGALLIEDRIDPLDRLDRQRTPALTEPDVSLSAHPAPTVQPSGAGAASERTARAGAGDACKPGPRTLLVSPQALVFPHWSSLYNTVEMAQRRVEGGLVEAAPKLE